ncbi:MAG: exodeoxyribonuclease III, partial [Sandaracinaceae bacterium]|nr:exodeoxyribonuclease III [Sandaracinaceae bacterium]
GDPEMDKEGRLQIVRLGSLIIANVYFPNGSGYQRDNGRVPFKLAFYRKLSEYLQRWLDENQPIVVIGDFNTAPEPIDLARPRENEKTSGFLPEEREEIARWKSLGWIDAFRLLYPDRKGAYTWWRWTHNARERNIGWRIDLAMLSPKAASFLKEVHIHHEVMGSDHCPVSIELDDGICKS